MLHRVRVYNPTPVAVKCLTGCPGRLALAREDSSIELWSTRNTICKITQFNSPYGCVEALTFAISSKNDQKLSLYSAGMDSKIIRYSECGTVEEDTILSGSAIWCLEASPCRTKLAAGTEDGCIHIIETSHGTITPWKRLQRKLAGRVLSVAWFPCGTKIVSGSPDTLKIWNVDTERPIDSITLSRVFKKQESMIFSVAVVQNGETIVSGDSTGKVIFWHASTASQIQSFKLHAADVLILHAFGDEVYASGVDPIIYKFYFSENRWMHQKITQMHTHDIRAIQRQGDILFTAGVDSQLGVVHLNTENLHFQRILPPAFHSNIQCHENVILVNYKVKAELWIALPNEKVKLLVKINASPSNPFRLISMGRSGFVLVGDTKVLVFKFSLSKENKLESCEKVYSYDLPIGSDGVRCCLMNPSGRRVFLALHDGRLQLVNVAEEVVETRAKLSGYPITCWSSSAQYVAFGDSQCNVSLFDHDLKLKCHLPKHSSIPIALHFELDRLYVAHDDLTFYEFCTKSEKYADWSNSCLKDSSFEEKLSHMRTDMMSADGIHGMVITPGNDVLLAFEAKAFLARKKLLPTNVKEGLVVSKDMFNLVKMWRLGDDVACCEVSGNQLAAKLPPILKKKRFI